jgi:propionate CoA-transferase
MSKVISASAAAALVKDGATVGASALTLAGWPEELAMAMEKRFLASGHPANLTLVHASGIGDWKTKGTEHFAHHGMVARWIGGHTGLAPGLARMVVSGACEGYCVPQGVVTQLWREIAAHRPGLITKTGLVSRSSNSKARSGCSTRASPSTSRSSAARRPTRAAT